MPWPARGPTSYRPEFRTARNVPPSPAAHGRGNAGGRGRGRSHFRRQWAADGLNRPGAPPSGGPPAARPGADRLDPLARGVRQLETRRKATAAQVRLEDLLGDRRFCRLLRRATGRAYVGTEGGPFIVFRRRRFVAWLSDQIMESRPYDAIVRDLIPTTDLDRPAGHQLRHRDLRPREESRRRRAARRPGRAGPSSASGSTAPSATTIRSPPGNKPTSRASPPSSARSQSGLTGIHDRGRRVRPSRPKTGEAEDRRAPRPVPARAAPAKRATPIAAGPLGHRPENPHLPARPSTASGR